MGQHVIDFSWARPDPQAVKDAGFVGVIGYVGKDRTGKLLQKEWYDRYRAAGLSVCLVWELGEQHALAGYGAGVQDARDGAAQAAALGHDGCVYYVLEDPRKLPRSDWPKVAEYAQGLNDAGAGRELGGYGSKALLNHVKDLGLIRFQWYVGPWGPNWDGADIIQTYRDDVPPIAGTPDNQYDEDYCPNADWGQSPRPDQEDEDLTPELEKALQDMEGRLTLHIEEVLQHVGTSEKRADGSWNDTGVAGQVHIGRRVGKLTAEKAGATPAEIAAAEDTSKPGS